MWEDPWHRRAGTGRAMLDRLIAEAGEAGYVRVRLDSPDFMTAAHELYYSRGFKDTQPYSGTEVPDVYWSYWVFMEKSLPRSYPPPARSDGERRQAGRLREGAFDLPPDAGG